ncbi:MAG: hypothetical protein WCD83_09555, partial [Pseudolabrys sp.]
LQDYHELSHADKVAKGSSVSSAMIASNHAMERTATRRVFTFVVGRSSSLQLTRGLGDRRSALSR